MQILLACAKIMRSGMTAPAGVELTEPRFLPQAATIAAEMRRLSPAELARLLHCSAPIAAQNALRYLQWADPAVHEPAVLAYHGQAYKHLRAETFTAAQLQWTQRHLFITSFLYGLLRPLDRISPYRMEGAVKLYATGGADLFAYWRPRLTDALISAVKADDGILVHLATEEMEHLFDWRQVCAAVRVVQPHFMVDDAKGLRVMAVHAKTCRGAMTRFIIEHKFSRPEALVDFNYQGFTYDPLGSDQNQMLFKKI